MDAAKIRLSAKEMRIARSVEFILTKNAILQKIKLLFGELKLKYDKVLEEASIDKNTVSAKISRGENYKGLPWVILDHPRYFSKKDIIAIRTLFWWGNFFSITLHLSGRPKEDATPKLLSSFKKLRKQGFLVCINKDQWQHDLGKRNYRSLKNMKEDEFAELVTSASFVKLVHRISLKKWEKAQKPLVEYFSVLSSLISYQGDGKDL